MNVNSIQTLAPSSASGPEDKSGEVVDLDARVRAEIVKRFSTQEFFRAMMLGDEAFEIEDEW